MVLRKYIDNFFDMLIVLIIIGLSFIGGRLTAPTVETVEVFETIDTVYVEYHDTIQITIPKPDTVLVKDLPFEVPMHMGPLLRYHGNISDSLLGANYTIYSTGKIYKFDFDYKFKYPIIKQQTVKTIKQEPFELFLGARVDLLPGSIGFSPSVAYTHNNFQFQYSYDLINRGHGITIMRRVNFKPISWRSILHKK